MLCLHRKIASARPCYGSAELARWVRHAPRSFADTVRCFDHRRSGGSARANRWAADEHLGLTTVFVGSVMMETVGNPGGHIRALRLTAKEDWQ